METTAIPIPTERGRGGAPAGPRPDPKSARFWVVDRRGMRPELSRPLPREDAWRRLRALLRHRDPWDPWVQRLAVFATATAPSRVVQTERLPRPFREVPDPYLVSWEIAGRRERLGWSRRRLALAAGLSPAVLHAAEHLGGLRLDSLEKVRATLLAAEHARGLVPGAD